MQVFKKKSDIKKLNKKKGDDKLVISLVLIAVGVILCFIYKDSINTSITSAVKSLDEKVGNLFTNSDEYKDSRKYDATTTEN